MNEGVSTKLASIAFNDYRQSVLTSKEADKKIAVLCQLLIQKGFDFDAKTSKPSSDILSAKRDIIAVLVNLAETSLKKAYRDYLYEIGKLASETPSFSKNEKQFKVYIKHFVIYSKKMRNDFIYDKFSPTLFSISEEYKNMKMNMPDKHSEYVRNTLDHISICLISEIGDEVGYKLPIVNGCLGNQELEMNTSGKNVLEKKVVIGNACVIGEEVEIDGFIAEDIVIGGSAEIEAKNVPRKSLLRRIIVGENFKGKIRFVKSDVNKEPKICKIIVGVVTVLAGLATIIMLILQFF